MSKEQVVKYKGRPYRLLRQVSKDFGEGMKKRAQLEFEDGSQQFWVDAERVEGLPPEASSSPAPAASSGVIFLCPHCRQQISLSVSGKAPASPPKEAPRDESTAGPVDDEPLPAYEGDDIPF